MFKMLKKIFRKFINFIYIISSQNLYTIIININNKQIKNSIQYTFQLCLIYINFWKFRRFSI